MKNLYKNTFSVSKKNYCLSLILFFFLCAGNIKAQTGELVTTVEAEDGIMTGVRVENSIAGFSGIGYVTGFDDSSDKVTVTVTVSKKAFYQILIRYHSNDVKTQNMSINGCLLYTSDAADEEDSVDLGGRRIIKKKKKKT